VRRGKARRGEESVQTKTGTGKTDRQTINGNETKSRRKYLLERKTGVSSVMKQKYIIGI